MEEAELVAPYKGIELVEERDKNAQVKRDQFGRPKKKQRGQSSLYKEFGVRKQLLDDLYIRFLRLAEERIGEAAKHGVVSYISNSSYLTGRSHPIMRRSLLTNFHRVWIDNLNGDKFRTGKIIPKGLPGEGTGDQSIFTTDSDPRGIQPGTAIVTWLKQAAPKAGPDQAHVDYRDLWGLANRKRTALLSSLSTGAPLDSLAAPAYSEIKPAAENRWRLSPHTQEPGYESWPGLDELFPVRFQGVNHNRGLEGSVIDRHRPALLQRMKAYFDAASFGAAAEACPDVATERARYEPKTIWSKLKGAGGFSDKKIKPFLTFPLDQRWIYYETEHKLLNEARPEFSANLDGNEFLVTVPEPRKVSETRPLYATTLVNLHVHERGSVVIPREIRGDGLLADSDANLPESAWRVLRDHFGLTGHRLDEDARRFAGKLIRIALGVLHAPVYQADHRSALSADWAHLPIPRDVGMFQRLAETGDSVARLLDAHRDARDDIFTVLGEERAVALAQFRKFDGSAIQPEDLKITVNYWGGAKGRWVPRAFTSEEEPLPEWGERTGDLYIGEDVFFANVPEAVWSYELGGYPILKKWLAYRQANRRVDKRLSAEERRWFKAMVQRIATLLALYTRLDELYSAAAENAFTAQDLEIK